MCFFLFLFCFFLFLFFLFFFFFQAEDGIRDIGVTGVQTCALPIYLLKPTFSILRKILAVYHVFELHGAKNSDCSSNTEMIGQKQN